MRHRNRPAQILAASALAAAFAVAALPSVSGAFTAEEQKCRAAVAKGGAKVAKTAVKAMTSCHKSRDADGAFAATDCNDITETATASKVTDAEGKFTAGIPSKCPTGTPADMLYLSCPAPCNVSVPAIADFGDVTDCLNCLVRDGSEEFSSDANALPTSPIADAAVATCHASITKNTSKLYNSAIKTVTKCQASGEKASPALENTTACTVTDYDTLVSDAYDKCLNAVMDSCGTVMLPSAALAGCGSELTNFDLAACACDAAKDGAQVVAAQLLDLSAPPVTTTTTNTLPVGDPLCPDRGELVIYSKMSNTVCASNMDCAAPYYCNSGSARCETVADLDTGWTGVAHDSDTNQGVTTRGLLYCPGPGPVCGECDVLGIDPSQGNCRCSNNVRTICDQPFANDGDDCGGAVCDCYFGPPFPLNSAGTTVCVSNRFSENISGTANVDLGEGQIAANLRSKVFLGLTDRMPCPVCAGKCSQAPQACTSNANCTLPAGGKCIDGFCSNGCLADADCGMGNTCLFDTPNDQVRDGVCMGDNAAYPSSGNTCDANATNASFPAVYSAPAGGGGGQYSIDCQPAVGKNVSGAGLKISLNQTTGSASIAAALECGLGGTELCQCKVCSKDASTPCTGNADCAPEGSFCELCTDPGQSSTLCSCNTNSDCAAVPAGTCSNLTSTCTAAAGVACTTNSDCATAAPVGGACIPSVCTGIGGSLAPLDGPEPNDCTGGYANCVDMGGGEGECSMGPVDQYCDGLVRADGTGMRTCANNAECNPMGQPSRGNCTVLDPRDCFLPTIQGSGAPDPQFPQAVSVFCVPATSNGSVNLIAGLPGPGRVITQAESATFCASNPAQQYVPGVGGCP